MSNQKTNVEVVVNLMEFSAYGALAQLFVMDALGKYARHVADSPPEAFESMKGGFISPEAWQGVAREVAEKVEKHLSPKKQRSSHEEMTKEDFLAMQTEIEALESSIAKGEEMAGNDSRLSELQDSMDNSPWEFDPDEGVVEKRSSGYRP